MFDKYLEAYILKMESIKLIKETIEKYIPNRINNEVNKYQDAILMDFYFEQLLSGKVDEEIEKHVQKFITINEINSEDKKISYKFNRKTDKLSKFKNIEEARNIVSIGSYTMNTMYNNILISIFIEFENMVTKIFEEIIRKYPEAYLKETNVSYTEIVKAQDINQIKEKIISNVVDMIMRENIFEWINIIRKKHKKIFSFENKYMKKFIEAYFRRNIIVHNESKINRDYINGMKNIEMEIEDEAIGKKLICTEEYINEIIDSSIYVIIYFIYQIISLFEEHNESFTNTILNMGFERIKNEEYVLSREIFRLIKDNKTIDQQTKIYSMINYWQTYKWDGKYEEIKNEIEEFDISAYEELIKLAVYALKDEYEKIKDILEYEFTEEKQNIELAIELEDFPVFKELRKQQFYKELKEKYPDAFIIKSTQIEENEINEILKNKKGKFQIEIGINKASIKKIKMKKDKNEEKK